MLLSGPKGSTVYRGRSWIFLGFVALLLVGGLVAVSIRTAAGQEALWTRQFGSTQGNDDEPFGVVLDSADNIYVVGRTRGAFPGQTSFGSSDAYLRKYGTDGNELWTRQFGTRAIDVARGVGVDVAGNLYVVGYKWGSLPHQTRSGRADGFVVKYDSEGNEVWTRQFGTASSDSARGADVDRDGNLYVVGWTGRNLPGQTDFGRADAYLRKYDGDGNELWTRQFGTREIDVAHGVVIDGLGNPYVVGETHGVLPGQIRLGKADAYLRKYDTDGNEIWTRQFGTQEVDVAFAISVDGSGNVYVVGASEGTLPGRTEMGGWDTFARKFDSNGNEVWTRQFGTRDLDVAEGLAVDGAGNLYVVGRTEGTIPGQTRMGGRSDAFIRGYDVDGNEVWTHQFGTQGSDIARSVTVDGSGNLYVVGLTDDALPGETSSGGFDAFVVKMSTGTRPSPTPTPLPTPFPTPQPIPLLHLPRRHPRVLHPFLGVAVPLRLAEEEWLTLVGCFWVSFGQL